MPYVLQQRKDTLPYVVACYKCTHRPHEAADGFLIEQLIYQHGGDNLSELLTVTERLPQDIARWTVGVEERLRGPLLDRAFKAGAELNDAIVDKLSDAKPLTSSLKTGPI